MKFYQNYAENLGTFRQVFPYQSLSMHHRMFSGSCMLTEQFDDASFVKAGLMQTASHSMTFSCTHLSNKAATGSTGIQLSAYGPHF